MAGFNREGLHIMLMGNRLSLVYIHFFNGVVKMALKNENVRWENRVCAKF